MSPSAPTPANTSQIGLNAVGIFLFFGAVMASLAGITLGWPGTTLDRIWKLNPDAYSELSPLGRRVGFLFLALSAALAIAAVGWSKRTQWGWRLALAIVATQVIGDILNMFRGNIVQGMVGAAIAGALFFYMTRPFIRAHFVARRNSCPQSMPREKISS